MADELETPIPTPAPADTPSSPSEQPPVTPPAEESPVEQPPAEQPDDGTVLGGKDSDDAPDGDEPAAGPPEKYELALEGVTLDTELVTQAEPIFRELGLTNDQANALLPLAPKLMEKAQTAMLAALSEAGAQQKKDWLDAYHADAEIGGAKREETEHLAAKGLDALGFADGHPFRKALSESGFGNHPDMIRAWRKIGELVGEDGSFVRPDSTAAKDIPTDERWYGNKQGA